MRPDRAGAIPAELRELDQWVTWRREQRDGEPKPTKAPYVAVPRDRTGVASARASSTDPSTWRSFEQAVEVAAGYDGVGFVFSAEDPFVGIDLDDVIDGGRLHPAAAELISELDSYVELSPSGTGVHVFVRGTLNGGRHRTSDTLWGGGIELYAEARFFCMTGHALGGLTIEERSGQLDAVIDRLLPPDGPDGTRTVSRTVGARTIWLARAKSDGPDGPDGPDGSDGLSSLDPQIDVTDEEIVKRARSARNGAKFDALWAGSTAGYPSQSEADLALCGLLAFWTGPNPEHVDGLFRQSGLMRAKWDQRHGDATYGRMTVERALSGRREYYDWSDRPKPKRETSALSDLTVPDWLRAELEQAGVSDEEAAGVDSMKDLMKLLGGGKESMATRIVKLVLDVGVELFHDDAGRCYATFAVGGHVETWPLDSQAFRRYARRLLYEKVATAPNGQAITDALGVLEAKAAFEGAEQPVHVRVAGDAHRIVIDLGDPQWRAIEITRAGWRVLDHHPLKFRRTGGMAALPAPAVGGNVELLRPFVNVSDDDAWKLVVAWLLAALRPGYPYPVLIAHGEQGSAKSTLGRVARALVDPSVSPLRVAPHDIDDLMVSATCSWVVAYDNVSRIPPSLSDALCRLSTGGGLSKRQLYTDADEVLLDVMRPVVLNGIDEVAHRSDLLDRALLVEMPVIPEGERKSEEAFWAAFTAQHALILGGLCDALVVALARVGDVRLQRLPRMADFARWVTAAEPALGWSHGTFLASYGGNRAEAHEVAVETSVIGPALLALGGFFGTMSELLGRLEERATEQQLRARDWPRSARALRGDLDRFAPNLRALGYEVEHSRQSSSDRTRMVTIARLASAEQEELIERLLGDDEECTS